MSWNVLICQNINRKVRLHKWKVHYVLNYFCVVTCIILYSNSTFVFVAGIIITHLVCYDLKWSLRRRCTTGTRRLLSRTEYLLSYILCLFVTNIDIAGIKCDVKPPFFLIRSHHKLIIHPTPIIQTPRWYILKTIWTRKYWKTVENIRCALEMTYIRLKYLQWNIFNRMLQQIPNGVSKLIESQLF